jgi:tetraacyldisaccharide 4'-kinase
MAWDYRAIMSGERRGPQAALVRGGLHAASGLYRIAVAARNHRFDHGSSEIHRCGVPAISIGNLTTGGTGKTPIVCFLARTLRRRGLRVSIISRGYGRGDADANDEAMELADRLPDVPHVQDPDRVEAARIAVEELDTQIVLMDDGFQHRRLHRDLDIVVIDATCPFGYGHLLPRGLLREPIASLRRADLVILSRCDLVGSDAMERIESTIGRMKPGLGVVRTRHAPSTLMSYPDTYRSAGDLAGRAVAVVSAIGNPDAFERTVASLGAQIVAARQLPDHDAYSPQSVDQLQRWIRALGTRISALVCTHKDLVKLRTDRLGGLPVEALLIEAEIVCGGERLQHVLDQCVAGVAFGCDG